MNGYDLELELLLNEVVGAIIDMKKPEDQDCQTTPGHHAENHEVYFWLCLTKDGTGDCERVLKQKFEQLTRQMEAKGLRALDRLDVPRLPDEHCLAKVGGWFSRPETGPLVDHV